ncbi:hypothetical protein DV515_00014847 [Chloebia gouldiae]|uniref:Uncharacterized protein n=1 Tax=Chloebia gouldiae TaxID=44316 RepID=A0A3L8RY79_CHLGU|nr:hypothetical protein DV515_00014847 [Chloebia gouldiae]
MLPGIRICLQRAASHPTKKPELPEQQDRRDLPAPAPHMQEGARGQLLSSDLHRVTCPGTRNLGITTVPSPRDEPGEQPGFHTKERWKDFASLGRSGVPGRKRHNPQPPLGG